MKKITTLKRFIFITLLVGMGAFSAKAQWAPAGVMGAGATDGCFSFVIGGKGYVGGGSNGSHFYSYDTATHAWSLIGNAPGNKIRGWAFAFAVNGKAYVGGGDTTGNFTECADVWEFNPADSSWTQLADFPGGVRDATFSFVVGDTAYVGGGFDGANIWNDFWKYDAANNQWTELNATPTGAILFPSTFVLNNKGYVAVGEVTTTTTETEVKALWVYDPSTGGWEQKHDFPGTAIQAGFGFALDGYGYVGGGQSGYNTVYNAMYKYDPAGDSWAQAEDITTDFSAWTSAFTIGDEAYVGTGSYFGTTSLFGTDSFHKYKPTVATGVNQLASARAVPPLYPNPTREYIHLGSNVSKDATISVYDVTGRCVKTFTGTAQNNLYIGDLKSGVYLLKTTAGSQTDIQRFTKE